MGAKKDVDGYSLGSVASADVAKRVKSLMAEQGKKQLALSRETEIPQGHISNLLTGSRNFQKWQVAKIATALGVEERALLPASIFGDESSDLKASREGFLARHRKELAQADVESIESISFLRDPGAVPDDEWWWVLVEAGRRSRERAATRRASGGKRKA